MKDNVSAWTCNKCNKVEKMMMNGLCVVCYMAKNKLEEE